MLCVPLATPGTEACDAVGGAFRLEWREWPGTHLIVAIASGASDAVGQVYCP